MTKGEIKKVGILLNWLCMGNKGEKKMMKRALIIKNRFGMIMFSVLLMIFTSVTAYAIEERFVFSDLTATDKKTGLMWTRDADIAKKSLTWKKTIKFIEELNKQKYAGHNDWRLPKKEELQTLVNYAKSQGHTRGINFLLNKVGFKNAWNSYYWSSSTHAMAGAWLAILVVDMYNGNVYKGTKDGNSFVWPVRAGQ